MRGVYLCGLVHPTIAEEGVARILHAIYHSALLAVEPHVADHAVPCRVCSSSERRVANDRLCVSVSMVRIDVHQTLVEEVAKAALTQSLVVTPRQIAAQLIDGDL